MRCDVRRREFYVSCVCALPKMLVNRVWLLRRDRPATRQASRNLSQLIHHPQVRFSRSSQPASGKGCCVVRFYFGKVQSSGFLGIRNNRCLFLLLRFNYLAGKDKEMTHFGDQLRERREVYSALLLDWFTDDPFASGLDHHRKFSLPVKLQTMSGQIPLEEGGRQGPSKGSLLSTLKSTIVV